MSETSHSLDLSNVPEKELRTEIAKRERERRERAQQAHKENVELWMGNLDLLKRLVPKHRYQDCGDDKVHEERGCLRCDLLYAERFNYWPEEWMITLKAEPFVLPPMGADND